MTAPQRYPTYKRVTSAVVLVICALWAAYLLLWPNGSKAAGTGIAVGSPAPEFELKDINGKTYKLSDFKGKPMIINFFATWCAPCRAETPLLQETYKQYQDKGFVIVAVNLGESNVAIKAFQEKFGVTFPMVIDQNDRVSRLYDIVPLPTNYFVDKKGIVQAKWTGELTKSTMENLLKKIIQ